MGSQVRSDFAGEHCKKRIEPSLLPGTGSVIINGKSFSFKEEETIDIGTIPKNGNLQIKYNPSFVPDDNSVITNMDVNFDGETVPDQYDVKDGVYSVDFNYTYKSEVRPGNIEWGIYNSEGDEIIFVFLKYQIKSN